MHRDKKTGIGWVGQDWRDFCKHMARGLVKVRQLGRSWWDLVMVDKVWVVGDEMDGVWAAWW